MPPTDIPASPPNPLQRELPFPHESPGAWIGAGAVLASLFIAVFAFLLASFPARNPDVWGHLAVGRALLRGASPGTASWAGEAKLKPGWLFDLSAYGIYSAVGGGGLVLIKAVLVVVLGLILLRSSRIRDGWLIPLVCMVLALLTMGSRLLLQPATVSYLFLALTWWFVRPRAGHDDHVPARPTWPLLILFLVWANTDRWVLMGLAVVGLVWLGRTLDQPTRSRSRVLLRRAAALAMLAGVCLINPGHISAFALPPELTAGGARGVRSPFQSVYFEAISESPAGLAYYPLLGLGLLSFALAPWRWERFLPWAALAALSAVQVRTVPFFAIVAGPVLAWNLQDFFARRKEPTARGRGRIRRFAPYAFGGLLGVAFLACAWTGWLQAPPFEPRRWAIETPMALERGAEAVCRWHSDGRLGPEARGLHLSPDSAAEFAWFCPAHRSVQDPALVAGVVGDSDAPMDWSARMRAAGINHVVVYETNRPRLVAALERLLADPVQWPLLHLEGGLTVFGWRDPSRASDGDLFRFVELDPDRLALDPRPEEMPPLARPAHDPQPRRWWEAFWKPAPPPPIDRDGAALYLLQSEVLRRSAGYRHRRAWEATQVVGLVGSADGWVLPMALFDARARLAFFRPSLTGSGTSSDPLGRWAMACQPAFTQARDDTPMAIIYLAIRAARRAVAANPRDAQAHASLGEAYLRLLRNTRERAWAGSWLELGELRRAQAAAALTRAVALDPGLSQAHLNLAALYGEMAFLDLALKHQREYLNGMRKSRTGAAARTKEHRDAVAEIESRVDSLAEVVEQLEREFDRDTAGMRVVDRATLARDRGLAGRARDILLESDISAFGAAGMALELELLVRTGRVQEVRNWTSPEQQDALGPMYHWLRIQAFAASGDYALAQVECDQLAEGPSGPRPRQVMAALAGQALCDGLQPFRSLAGPAWDAVREAGFRSRLRQLVAALRREADTITLRGLLQLEAGDTQAAAADFRLALTTWGSESAAAERRGIDFIGRVVAQGALAWIESVPARREP